MGANVLVDTSAWIEFFRHPRSHPAETVDHLITEELACVTGAVIAELLRGLRSVQERQRLLNLFSALPCLESTHEIWIKTGILAATLGQHGMTLPLTDVLIAVVAQENGCAIYTTDAHFTRIPSLKLYPPSSHPTLP